MKKWYLSKCKVFMLFFNVKKGLRRSIIWCLIQIHSIPIDFWSFPNLDILGTIWSPPFSNDFSTWQHGFSSPTASLTILWVRHVQNVGGVIRIALILHIALISHITLVLFAFLMLLTLDGLLLYLSYYNQHIYTITRDIF